MVFNIFNCQVCGAGYFLHYQALSCERSHQRKQPVFYCACGKVWPTLNEANTCCYKQKGGQQKVAYGQNRRSTAPPGSVNVPFGQTTQSSKRTQCTIEWDTGAQAYNVSSPFNPNFVDFVKARIPGQDRAWNPTTKTWFINETWFDLISTLAKELWPNEVFIKTRSEVEDAFRLQQDAQRQAIMLALPERERALLTFVDLLPFEALQAAYRKGAMLLHPDRNGGHDESMTKLNTSWTEVEKICSVKK